ncbi:MAG: helix-turn-helix transcriptional regulator [Pseudomonadota bacterium]|nr:helix-turn-helix transcriptional regulator [Pseudomonadota bacterium]
MSLQLFFERLRKERDELGYTQEEMAESAKVSKRSYCAYEAGETAPSAKLLTALAFMGMDVAYLLTGQRHPAAPEPRLSADERELLALYRAAPLAVKAAAIGALQGGAASTGAAVRQTSTGAGAVQVAHAGGGVTISAPPPKTARRKAADKG